MSKYNKLHGNKIVFEEKGHHEHEKETDFFDEIHKTAQKVENVPMENQMRLFEAKVSFFSYGIIGFKEGWVK